MEKTMNFQVNLTGLIDLLSNHLYSNPGVFLRELLQNGVDAITARKQLGHSFSPKIHVETYSNHMISIQDNGIGLTEQDMIQFLASIGSTIKKNNLDSADDFIGQFGVGLLSCFIVSEEIVLLTRSALEGDSLEWKGKPDGTYQIRKLDYEVPIGTTVYLKAKPEYTELFEYYELMQLLKKYGKFLNIHITLLDDGYEEVINEELLPWELEHEAASKFILDTTGNQPLDIIPLYSNLGGIKGFASILPYSVNVQEKKRHRVYLKNMLLSEELSDLLPEWAFFVDAFINTTSLKPTASREAFQQNDLFFHVQEELGSIIKQYFMNIANQNRPLLEKILKVHYQSIKLIAIEDYQLYELFIPYLKFETTYGELDMATIMKDQKTLYVTATVDEFRQIARVAKSQNILVVNGGYQHDFGLLTRANRVWDEVKIEVMDVMKFSNQFTPLTLQEQNEAFHFIALANEFMEKHQCKCIIRYFEPADLPVLFTTNKDLNFWKIINESIETSEPLFFDLLNTLKSESVEEPFSNLCFNFNNPMIRKVIASHDRELHLKAIELFYTQALLMGNHVMSNDELKLMNESLFYFMNLGLEQVGERKYEK